MAGHRDGQVRVPAAGGHQERACAALGKDLSILYDRPLLAEPKKKNREKDY